MKMNEKILQCRKRMGLSQEELARRLNTSRQAVSKWELGDAQPELNNIIALARLFGVTTDWLLMDTEEETEENIPSDGEIVQEYEQTEAEAPPAPSTSDDWMDRLPRMLVGMVRRWGWLSGVYIALIGLGNLILGALATTLSNSMVGHFVDTARSINGFGPLGNAGMTLYDEAGAVITDPALYQALGVAAPKAQGSGIFNPVAALGTVMMIFGVLAIIAGIALALYLKKKFAGK